MTAPRTALVTGATSGLGFEAAAQLADQGFSTVYVSGRTDAKAANAAQELAARTGKDVFQPLTLDLDSLATVDPAVAGLSGAAIDTLILNAGIAPPNEKTMSPDGIERTVSSSLIGHHRFTMRLLEHGLLSEDAAIVIAGSEAARGDVPTFSPVDLNELAASGFSGNLEEAIEAQMKMTAPAVYKASDVYATAKVFVAWWSAELARRLPEGMTVNTVSPGSTPDTNAIRNAPFYMRYFMVPLFKIIPGMSHTVADGAKRYLDVAAMGNQTGRFYASKPGKMTGTLTEVELDHIHDRAGQTAAWNVTVELAGVGYPVAA